MFQYVVKYSIFPERSSMALRIRLLTGRWAVLPNPLVSNPNPNQRGLGSRDARPSSVRHAHSDVGDLYRKEAVQRYVRRLMEDHEQLSGKLQRARLSEPERSALQRKHLELRPVVTLCQHLDAAATDLQDVVSLLQGTVGTKDEDPQMTEMLKEEEVHISNRIEVLKRDLVKGLLPPDQLDSSHVILEVSAGRTTGGDICQQFTREMFDMYQGYSSYMNWTFDILNYTHAEYGGLHHGAAQIRGEAVYRHLKNEGGTHRVQRIPEVGLSSRMQRVHTGTMAVIVLPQPLEFELSIDARDLRVDTFRSSGAGGQSVNTTDSAVRIVHLPSGTAVECQQSRSQLQNRDTAMSALRARLHRDLVGKETQKRQMARKKQVGTRSQSERIRSYNFSQDRVTDHRTGYVTRDLKEFMKGGEALDQLIQDVLEHGEREALLDLVEGGCRG